MKAGHVGPDLGEDDLGRSPPDTRDRDESLDQPVCGPETLLDLGVEPIDERVEIDEVTQLASEEEALVGTHAAGECRDEGVALGAQPPAGEVRECVGVCHAPDQGAKDRPARDAADVRAHRAELDVGTFEHLGDPVDLTPALGHRCHLAPPTRPHGPDRAG
jgi:hypothetical protein